MTERVELYLWKVSRLMIDVQTLTWIGISLDMDQSVIDSCLTDHPESIQNAGFFLLKDWKQSVHTNDLDALRSRLRPAFQENNLIDQFLKISVNSEAD